ncbi:hypothetical protein AGMMS49579_08180 [Spirochaetia bacterium]|nr:hypothetical protein AGMMS49579_08180 [Spirochaetia bacterium]
MQFWMPRKENNLLHIQYQRKHFKGFLKDIGILPLVWIIMILECLDNILRVIFSKYIPIMFKRKAVFLIIIFSLIYITCRYLKMVFSDGINHEYYINLETKKIYFVQGISIFKEKIILNFEQIRDIILVKKLYKIEDDGKKIYSYKIDIYDSELNAYEICNGIFLYKPIKKLQINWGE